MEDIFLGLGLVVVFVLGYFAVDRFGRLMDRARGDDSGSRRPERTPAAARDEGQEPAERAEREEQNQNSLVQRASVVFVAADSRLFGRLRRETEQERINFL